MSKKGVIQMTKKRESPLVHGLRLRLFHGLPRAMSEKRDIQMNKKRESSLVFGLQIFSICFVLSSLFMVGLGVSMAPKWETTVALAILQCLFSELGLRAFAFLAVIAVIGAWTHADFNPERKREEYPWIQNLRERLKEELREVLRTEMLTDKSTPDHPRN